MKRLYDSILAEHLAEHRQMAFVAGPRQVGKTTSCRAVGSVYFDWDVSAHKRLIAAGATEVASAAGLDVLAQEPAVLVFDELHKFSRWKPFLKGFFDLYEKQCRVVVSGSSRLDTYRRGGDSLMGRYFPFRMHPFSVAELLATELPGDGIVRNPASLPDAAWQALWKFGGFPEPMLAGSERFSRRWQSLRHSQLYKEDIRDLTRIQELGLLEVTGKLLEERSGGPLVVANLARDVGVAPNTIKAWVDSLCALHVGFLVRPWHRNVSSSLRKEPKWYLRDWSGITDSGKRFETLVACHLLKAVEGWTDMGLGKFSLHYLRDKQQREVDFLVANDGHPWFLVEAKATADRLSPALTYFQQATGAEHAFQVVMNLQPVMADCFTRRQPTIVPALSFLSQLL
jgi:predicted AAA+ superfamily ATPase